MVPPNPQIIHFNKVFHCKPSILGYPYFWKHPCVHFFVPLIFGKKRSKICSQCWFQRCLIHVHPYLGKGLVLCLPRFAKSKLLYIYSFFFKKHWKKSTWRPTIFWDLWVSLRVKRQRDAEGPKSGIVVVPYSFDALLRPPKEAFLGHFFGGILVGIDMK